MLDKDGQGAQFVSGPLGATTRPPVAGPQTASAPAPPPLRQVAAEPLDALGVGVDRVLVDPTTAVVAGDVNEVMCASVRMSSASAEYRPFRSPSAMFGLLLESRLQFSWSVEALPELEGLKALLTPLQLHRQAALREREGVLGVKVFCPVVAAARPGRTDLLRPRSPRRRPGRVQPCRAPPGNGTGLAGRVDLTAP
jgi:hypothetical protein